MRIKKNIKTITSPFRVPKIREKKSIFVASAYPIASQYDVEECLAQVRIEMKKATHNAYAYSYMDEDGNLVANCHDDGEVHRTAGEPILNILGHFEVTNILVVVTRYYGRIHLGPAGLIKMYSSTAQDLLDNIELVEL